MKDSKVLLQELLTGIHLKERPEEIRSMAILLLENIFDLSRTDIMSGKPVNVTAEKARALQDAVRRINNAEPLQYVMGEEYFYGRKFHVNPLVLIPRPETEDLVRVVVEYQNTRLKKGQGGPPIKILDIGTGSGCLAVTLYLEMTDAEIYATDISPAALSVARQNADRLGAKVAFIQHDILNEELPFQGCDVMVSNPPYVTEKEKDAMRANVVDYEPHLALFVPDEDPLLFYKEIARQGRSKLKPGGMLAVEINERFGYEVSKLFTDQGFTDVAIIKDLAGKDRIVKGYNAPGNTT